MSASQIFHAGGTRYFNQKAIGSGGAVPTNWYVLLRQLDGLAGRPADAAAADTLTSNLSELSGSGYARQAVATASITEAASGNNSVLTFPQVTFNFTGTATATHAAVATTADNTGVLLFSAPLAAVRNFANGDVEKVTMTFTQEQGV